MRYLMLGCAVLLSACGGTAPSQAAQAPAPSEATACTAVVAHADLTGWRSVQAKGFTFCVPSNWSGSGRRQQHGEASITWGTGQPPARTATRVVQMHGGDLLPSAPTGSVVHSSSESIGGGDVHSFSESIGGAAASLYENDLVQGFITGATWRSKSIYLQGEARDRGTAEIELTIYRTVRFAAP